MPQSEINKTLPPSFGRLFTATVTGTDTAGTGVVTLTPHGQEDLKDLQGVPLAHTCAKALGFKESILPQVGTTVLCFGPGKTGYATIIGQMPPVDTQPDKARAGLPAMSCPAIPGSPALAPVHASNPDSLSKSRLFHNQLPHDVVQGEKVIANEFGVMLGLFQLMSVLKGSELAQVQCHFLDDLVRVVSHNFQHYSALGELNIFHDGQSINLEVGMTHNPAESIGVPQITKTEATSGPIKDTQVNDAKTNFYTISDERLKAVERLKVFIGKLGDFVNIMLTLPSGQPSTLDGKIPTAYDSGLLQLHAGLDGFLVVRSVKGIALEKTNWIRVPTRIRVPEDPAGDDGASLKFPERTDYEFDHTVTAEETAFLYYLQLRDYLAYIEEDLNYSSFNTQAKDFVTNNDFSKERDLSTVTFVDPTTGATFLRKRSLVALMPNGGVSMSDAWGSAITMEGGNIYIQPAKNLILQPLGDLVAKVGGNVAVAVNKEIDLSSTYGGMRVKTAHAQYLYSEHSGIVLQADGPINAAGTDIDQSAAQSVSGIVLKSKNAGITGTGDQITFAATGNTIVSGQTTQLFADNEIFLKTTGKAVGNVVIEAQAIELLAKSSITGYSQGSAILLGVRSTAIGVKNQTFGLAKLNRLTLPVEGVLDPAPGPNTQSSFFSQMNKQITNFDKGTQFTDRLFFTKQEQVDNVNFYFLGSDYYTNYDNVPQTIAQQEEISFPGLHGLVKWVETPVNGTYPYPGIDNTDTYTTCVMHNLTNTNGTLVNSVSNLKNKSTLNTSGNIFNAYTVQP